MLLTFLAGLLLLASSAETADTDRDGVPDEVEQLVLHRFAPRWFVGAGDCDGAPAEFVPDSEHPRVARKNGTIYGQVFKASRAGLLEAHFYHLWSRDCGRRGHPLDVEHVSVLLDAGSITALYWYASAHQDTSCEAGAVYRAAALAAERQGPPVWISSGKHASFLRLEDCRGGCGGDRCHSPTPLDTTPVINLGEPGTPMSGAIWTRSNRWSLSAKMRPDFDEPLLARLDALPGSTDSLSLTGSRGSMQAVILAGGRSLGSIESADGHARSSVTGAVATAHGTVRRTSTRVGRWIRERLSR